MVPSLDDIQQAINRLVHLVLEVSRGVARWGQEHHHEDKRKSGSKNQPPSYLTTKHRLYISPLGKIQC